jgi:hypothetical protein
VQVKHLESSSSIVATPELVRNNILPLIESFNGGIILVPNTSDMLVFDMPGCKVPAECVVDDKTATQMLNKAIAEFKKKNAPKPENKKPENKKPEPKVDESKKPEEKVDETPTNETKVEDKPTEPENKAEVNDSAEMKVEGIQITKVEGENSQEVKN